MDRVHLVNQLVHWAGGGLQGGCSVPQAVGLLGLAGITGTFDLDG